MFPTNYSYRPGVSTRSCPILIPNPECSLQTTVTVRVSQPGAVRYLYPTPSVPYKLQLPSGCLNQELSDTYTQPRVFLQTTVTVRVSQPGAVRYLYPTPSVPYKLQLPSGCLNQELSDTYTQPRVFPTNYSYRPGVSTRSCPILIPNPECSLQTTVTVRVPQPELSDTYTQPRVFPTNYSYRPGVSTRSCPILLPNPECSLQTTVTVRVPQPGAVRYLYPTPSVPYKLQLPSGCLNQELSDTYTQPRVFPTNYSYRPCASTRSCPILIPNPECSLQTTVTVSVCLNSPAKSLHTICLGSEHCRNPPCPPPHPEFVVVDTFRSRVFNFGSHLITQRPQTSDGVLENCDHMSAAF